MAGPVDRGIVGENEDVLGARGVQIIQEFLDIGEHNHQTGFSLIALVSTL